MTGHDGGEKSSGEQDTGKEETLFAGQVQTPDKFNARMGGPEKASSSTHQKRMNEKFDTVTERGKLFLQ
jgi:hypothetical protein